MDGYFAKGRYIKKTHIFGKNKIGEITLVETVSLSLKGKNVRSYGEYKFFRVVS